LTARHAARARVDAWLAAVAAAFGPSRDSSRIDALVAESGLSRQGVLFALDHVLERSPTEDEVATMIERAPARTAVAVILAANVFTAPSRAVAWALAQSGNVLVRPSRRALAFLDPLRAQVRIQEIGDDPALDVAAVIDELPAGAALHVYGGSTTVESIRRSLSRRPDLHAELHGPGLGAVIARADAIVAHADAIAQDLAVFDQRGCLSPRVALVVGDTHAAARAMHEALDRLDAQMPRGALTAAEAGEIALAIDAARYAGQVLVGAGHAVLDLGVTSALVVGPIGRVLPMVAVESHEQAVALLSPHASSLTTVATDAPDALRGAVRGRVARLGCMQTPPFDGPVDVRVLSPSSLA
jgi:hypothetical protein